MQYYIVRTDECIFNSDVICMASGYVGKVDEQVANGHRGFHSLHKGMYTDLHYIILSRQLGQYWE